jgi:hypothetical protein
MKTITTIEDKEAYSNFINSINSDITRKEYNLKLSYFIEFCQRSGHGNILEIEPAILESIIRLHSSPTTR